MTGRAHRVLAGSPAPTLTPRCARVLDVVATRDRRAARRRRRCVIDRSQPRTRRARHDRSHRRHHARGAATEPDFADKLDAIREVAARELRRDQVGLPELVRASTTRPTTPRCAGVPGAIHAGADPDLMRRMTEVLDRAQRTTAGHAAGHALVPSMFMLCRGGPTRVRWGMKRPTTPDVVRCHAGWTMAKLRHRRRRGDAVRDNAGGGRRVAPVHRQTCARQPARSSRVPRADDDGDPRQAVVPPGRDTASARRPRETTSRRVVAPTGMTTRRDRANTGMMDAAMPVRALRITAVHARATRLIDGTPRSANASIARYRWSPSAVAAHALLTGRLGARSVIR